MDVVIRCSDSVEDIQNFNLPRGKGGVAIAWKKQ
jgi:predicted HAD superfamily phosphohydrolase